MGWSESQCIAWNVFRGARLVPLSWELSFARKREGTNKYKQGMKLQFKYIHVHVVNELIAWFSSLHHSKRK